MNCAWEKKTLPNPIMLKLLFTVRTILNGGFQNSIFVFKKIVRRI